MRSITQTKTPEELRPGDVVLGRGNEAGYEVHAVEQRQGRFQVSDPAGGTHTYAPDDAVEVE